MLDPRVLDKMLPFLKDIYGNPASTEHLYGWEANESINVGREHIGNLINCSPNEIVFTSGATEANNIAILGSIKLFTDKAHTITVKTEHKSILDIFNYLSKNKTLVSYLDVMDDGIIDLNRFIDSINPNTKLVSIMMVNNEIGVIQPIKKIGGICREKGIIFHVDAAQAIGKMNINVKNLNIDIMSISGHKIYGPKGIGCLYINNETMKRKIAPLNFGGSHERGIRPGTLAVHNIVGLGEACRISMEDMEKDIDLINSLKEYFIKKLSDNCSNIICNGNMKYRIPGNLNLSFQNLNREPLIPKLNKIAISSGSACTSSTPLPSHVLKALGVKEPLIKSTIRIGIGRFNTMEEIDFACNYIIEVVNKLSVKKKEVLND